MKLTYLSLSLFFLILTTTPIVQAETLTSVLRKYSQQQVKVTVKYSTHSTILNETKIQSGIIILHQNKFYWQFTQPDPKEIYFNGKLITFVEPEKDHTMVTTKTITSPEQLVWFQLFSHPQKIKIIKHNAKTGSYQVKVSKYQVELVVQKGELKSLTYFDEIDSRINLEFSQTNFNDHSKVNYNYKVKPSDQVVNF